MVDHFRTGPVCKEYDPSRVAIQEHEDKSLRHCRGGTKPGQSPVCTGTAYSSRKTGAALRPKMRQVPIRPKPTVIISAARTVKPATAGSNV